MALPERIPYYTTRAQKSHQKQFTAFVSANEEVNANLAGTAYVSHRKDDCRKEDHVQHSVLSRCNHEHKLMPSIYYLDSCIVQNNTQ